MDKIINNIKKKTNNIIKKKIKQKANNKIKKKINNFLIKTCLKEKIFYNHNKKNVNGILKMQIAVIHNKFIKI